MAGVCVCAATLLVLGAKFWLIRANGNVTPFWDQWAEAQLLFDPYLRNQLTWSDLLAAHNEHRMFFTRVGDLLLLELAGHWDPILQMLINAMLHVGSIAILTLALCRLVRDLGYFSLCLWTGILFAIPFGWENKLMGFQSFYFLLILSTLALILLIPAPALSGRWWIGSGVASASVLCISSGALTMVPVIVIRCWQLALSKQWGRPEWIGLGLQTLATVALILTVPTIPGHVPLRAHSIGQFAVALGTIVGWPVPLKAGAPLLVFLPLLVFAGWVCRRRPGRDDPAWFPLGMGLWLGVQFLSLAYGRAVGFTSSRYLNIVLVGLVVNFAVLSCLVRESLLKNRHALAASLLGCVWVIIVAYCLLANAISTVVLELANKRETGQIQKDNVQTFLRTGDAAVLRDKPYLDVPYPDPEALRRLLEDKGIRSILPRELTNDGPEVPGAQTRLFLKGYLLRAFEQLKAILLKSPALLLALSSALFAFVIPTIALHRRRRLTPDRHAQFRPRQSKLVARAPIGG